ncbi:MAG: hypothetical protein KGP28_11580 [Bdellovibrionales bacterium]|nr:hypothetical protein [Bdellovibrionales bacterium]
MNADNDHPYRGLTIYFGTKHHKEKAVQEAFSRLGITVKAVSIDTDSFGTFSGEIPRTGSVRDALQNKINEVIRSVPDARLILASEGSFGPHPAFPFSACDHEALLLWDRDRNHGFFVDHVSSETNFFSAELGRDDAPDEWIRRCRVPTHAMIVQAKDHPSIIFKALTSIDRIRAALQECMDASPVARAVLSADLRANQNPTRMKVIGEAASKLAERVASRCPSCKVPGFWPARAERGLPCGDCGAPTRVILGDHWKCEECGFQELKLRNVSPTADARFCGHCNP